MEKSTKISIREIKKKKQQNANASNEKQWRVNTSRAKWASAKCRSQSHRDRKRNEKPNWRNKEEENGETATIERIRLKISRLERTRDAIIIIKPYHISGSCISKLCHFVYALSFLVAHELHFHLGSGINAFSMFKRVYASQLYVLKGHYHKFSKTTEKCLMHNIRTNELCPYFRH